MGLSRTRSLIAALTPCVAPALIATLALCAAAVLSTTAIFVGTAWLAPGVALGAQTASISAALTPERLGQPTALSLGFELHAGGAEFPSPLTGIDFRYPRSLQFLTSELGLATCDPAKLQVLGPNACPANALIGSGSALVKFQVSPIVSEELVGIGMVAGPSQNGWVSLLISASGSSPVDGRILMTTRLVPGQLKFKVPLVEGIPEGPDVAIVRTRITIGGDLIYYRRSHGKRIAYRPRGLALPRTCPQGGFKFNATFSFLDGSQTHAQAVVRCPHQR